MIVVADTSPIRYLILIDEINLVPRIYGQVVIPETVLGELTTANAPDKVRGYLYDRPAWLEVVQLTSPLEIALTDILDPGESEAIQLAAELDADILLIGERRGRRIALDRGLDIIGTVGVLLVGTSWAWLILKPR